MKAFRRSRADRSPRAGRLLRAGLQAFRANQGLLLAGGVAYYTLLSIVPLLVLLVIVLSHVIAADELLPTLAALPRAGRTGVERPEILADMRIFIANRAVIGWTLAITLVFFSSLAFTVLENAMSVIFYHRVAVRHRHFVCLRAAAVSLHPSARRRPAGRQAVGERAPEPRDRIRAVGRQWSLGRLAGALLYLLGVLGEVILLASIYLVSRSAGCRGGMRSSAASPRRSCGRSRGHVLVWYFDTLSQVRTVYGSLTTAIVVLLSLEIAAIVLLFGAQVIAEYERISTEPIEQKPKPMKTSAPT